MMLYSVYFLNNILLIHMSSHCKFWSKFSQVYSKLLALIKVVTPISCSYTCKFTTLDTSILKIHAFRA